jgi:hypothetical protein
MAAPIAAVSSPFNRGELKELGRNIRSLTKETNGKILSTGTGLANCGGKFTLFGPDLNLSINEYIFPKAASAKILQIPDSPILCVSLLGPDEKPFSEECPPLSFRAAYLANLAMRPLEYGASGYSFEWRISSQVWLPGK